MLARLRSLLLLAGALSLAGCARQRGGSRERAPLERAPRVPAQAAAPPPAPERPPRADDLEAIDGVVEAALARRDAPGAVVVVVRGGAVAFERAYGLRSEAPERRPMTLDTVFDLASLTKAIATTPAILLLAEEGKLALSDPVSRHLPQFGQRGKSGITIEQLLVHTSGLIADNDLRDYAEGPARALERVFALGPRSAPGARFVYSDLGFIVLAALVERVSGEPLDVFARRRLFEPLRMRDTTFKPGAALAARAAPTEMRGGRFLQGSAHDPRAELLGGVAGHAGLFATGRDLSRFARMLLRGGELDGARLLAAASIEAMTRPRRLPGGDGLRALGWDVQTRYSGSRGALPGGFGHTGFTGTSIWVVPERQTAVIVLTSRLHPDGRGDVGRLRREVADVVARSLAAGRVD
jgi:serine-type D-Ala-D-Ala carboxypeptidase